ATRGESPSQVLPSTWSIAATRHRVTGIRRSPWSRVTPVAVIRSATSGSVGSRASTSPPTPSMGRSAPGGHAVTDAGSRRLRLRRRLRRCGCVVIGGCGFRAADSVFTPTHGPTSHPTGAPNPGPLPNSHPTAPPDRSGPTSSRWVSYPTARVCHPTAPDPTERGATLLGTQQDLQLGTQQGP